MAHIQCFDFDGVLFDHGKTWALYPGIRELLRDLHDKKYVIALASKRPENTVFHQGAIDTLRNSNVIELFSVIVIKHQSKVHHLQEITDAVKLTHKKVLSCVFYDDEKLNIEEVTQVGYRCVFIDNRVGLTSNDLILSQLKDVRQAGHNQKT